MSLKSSHWLRYFSGLEAVVTFLVHAHDLGKDDLPLVEDLHDEGSDLGHGTDQIGLDLRLGQVQGVVEQISKQTEQRKIQ